MTAAPPVQVDTLNILGLQCPVLVLLDRRSRQPQQKRWVFARVLEQILFQERDRSRGGLHVLLERLSIAGGCLTVDKASVATHKTITQTEFDQVYAVAPLHPEPPRCCTWTARCNAVRAVQDAHLPIAA